MIHRHSLVPRFQKTLAIPFCWKRVLHIHSFQSQNLLRETGVPVPHGKVAETLQEVREAIKYIGGPCYIKPQVIRVASNVGEPGPATTSGTQLAISLEQGVEVASQIIGHQAPTSDQNDKSSPIKRVYVEELIKYDQKWRLCLEIDRANYCPVVIFEEDASIFQSQVRDHSEHQFRYPFGFTEGITPALVRRIASQLSLTEQDVNNLDSILKGLYKIFVDKEATNLEINSLVRNSADGQLVCIDSHFTFDDAAQRRQPDIFKLRDFDQEVNEEVEAENHGLVYVRLDGNIGSVVNGAGLAMATNDAISFYGGKSANFLDAGGKATKGTMLRAFDIIMRDERVTAILVNIYGGLTRCDMIAESIIAAANELGPVRVPVVVRLQGTNSELGLNLLERANLGLHVEAGFGEASRKAVEVANQFSNA